MALPSTWGEPDVIALRGLLGCCHLLVDATRHKAVLIDTGLLGETWQLRRALKRHGLAPSDIEAILLTHGHLDHTGHLAHWSAWTGAPIHAHPGEQLHIDGAYPYRGAAKVCGRLEAFGRALLRYRAIPIDHPISDGLELPFWGGLRVVHLPGHTRGHCGFYSPTRRLLFTGDLFACFTFSCHLPPGILNSCPEDFPASLRRVMNLEPIRLIPNHYDLLAPARFRDRFFASFAKIAETTT